MQVICPWAIKTLRKCPYQCQYRRNCIPSGGVRQEESIWQTPNSLKENKGRNRIRGIYELSPRVQIFSYIHLASTAYPTTNFEEKILIISRAQEQAEEYGILAQNPWHWIEEEIPAVWKQVFILKCKPAGCRDKTTACHVTHNSQEATVQYEINSDPHQTIPFTSTILIQQTVFAAVSFCIWHPRSCVHINPLWILGCCVWILEH